jgi:hypothetical protein
MSKSTKAERPAAATLDEFRDAVKYVLINTHGMPELAANDVLVMDADYIEKAFAEPGDREAVVAEVASELMSDGLSRSQWVRVSGDTVVVEMSKQVTAYVDSLLTTGLYGEDASAVVFTMMCRGIESVLPILPNLARVSHTR